MPSNSSDAIRSISASAHSIIDLAIPVGSLWRPLRIGELKPLLAPARRLVYRCTESMLNVDDAADYGRGMRRLVQHFLYFKITSERRHGR